MASVWEPYLWSGVYDSEIRAKIQWLLGRSPKVVPPEGCPTWPNIQPKYGDLSIARRTHGYNAKGLRRNP